MTELYRTVGPVLYRRCCALLGDNDLARDAAQDAFVKLWKHRARLGDREGMLRWVFAVATNHCLNLRRSRRRADASLAQLTVREEAAADLFPERRLSQQLLSQFDSTTQFIAVGMFVDGMKREEIAHVLEVSPKTVSRKLARFVTRSRELLERSEP